MVHDVYPQDKARVRSADHLRTAGRAKFMTAFGPVVLAILLAALPGSAANAAQSKHRKPKQAPKAELIDCTKYGPGFVRIGADGCIKIGGSIDVDAGRNGK